MKRHIVVFYLSLFLLCLASKAVAAEVNLPFGKTGANLSERYQKLMAEESRLKKEDLVKYKILFVPGLFADHVQRIWGGLYIDQVAVLKTLGLEEKTDFEIIGDQFGFDGEQRIQKNALAVHRAILASPRPVLLISHSKGCVDTMVAMVRYPELQKKVHGWFTMQGPVWGSNVAEILTDSWEAYVLEPLLILSAQGKGSAIFSLAKTKRAAYLRKHLSSVERISKSFKVISFTSYKEVAKMDWKLKLLDVVYRQNPPSNLTDGLVDLSDAVVPGSDYVVAEGVDHTEPVMTVTSFDRKKLTLVSLQMLLGL